MRVPLRRLEGVGQGREQPCRSSVAAVPPDAPEQAATFERSPGAAAGSSSLNTRKSFPPVAKRVQGRQRPGRVASSALTDAVGGAVNFDGGGAGGACVFERRRRRANDRAFPRFRARLDADLQPVGGVGVQQRRWRGRELQRDFLVRERPSGRVQIGLASDRVSGGYVFCSGGHVVVGPTASLIVPDVITWGPAVTLSVNVAKAPPMSTVAAPRSSAIDRAILRKSLERPLGTLIVRSRFVLISLRYRSGRDQPSITPSCGTESHVEPDRGDNAPTGQSSKGPGQAGRSPVREVLDQALARDGVALARSARRRTRRSARARSRRSRGPGRSTTRRRAGAGKAADDALGNAVGAVGGDAHRDPVAVACRAPSRGRGRSRRWPPRRRWRRRAPR